MIFCRRRVINWMGAEKIYLPSLNCGHTATCPPMKQYLNRRAEENIQGGNKHRHQVYSIGKTLSFVRSDVHWFRDFADWNSRSFFLRSSHIGTGCSGTENNNNTFKHQDCEARQESCLTNPYEKPRHPAGVFSLSLRQAHQLCGWALSHFYGWLP